MKHILIVDLADDSKCCGCPCLDIWGNCLAIPHDIFGGAEIIDYIRPGDCPLRKMPKKAETNEDDDEYMKHYKQGINDTIDIINGNLMQIFSGD